MKISNPARFWRFVCQMNESQANGNTKDTVMQTVNWILVAQLLDVKN